MQRWTQIDRTIVGISFGFENVEGTDMLTIGNMDKDDVNILNISEVKRNLVTVGCNMTREMFVAKSVEVILNPKANKKGAGLFNNDQFVFDRIMECPDIVNIRIYYKNRDTEFIYVPWGGDSDFVNAWQKTEFVEDGKLRIVIRRKK